jgi:serine protease Do
VVGITTAKYSGSSSSGATIEGIGFAIPIDDVMPLVDDLVNYGYINSAYLGVMVSEMDSATATYYGLPVGAYVQEVIAGNCAEKAGLKAKDIIVALGSHKIERVSDLTKALRKFKAGDTTTITVLRKGREVVLEITLDERPNLNGTQSGDGNEIPMPSEGNYDEWYEYFYRKFYGQDKPNP